MDNSTSIETKKKGNLRKIFAYFLIIFGWVPSFFLGVVTNNLFVWFIAAGVLLAIGLKILTGEEKARILTEREQERVKLEQARVKYDSMEARIDLSDSKNNLVYNAKYLGGHSKYPKEIKNTSLILTTELIDIPELLLRIPYLDLLSVKVSYTLMPGAPTGPVGLFMGSRRKYYVEIHFKDEASNEEILNLEFRANNLKLNTEIQSAILRRKSEAIAKSDSLPEPQPDATPVVMQEKAAEIASKEGTAEVASTLYLEAGDSYLNSGQIDKFIDTYEKAGDNILLERDAYRYLRACSVYIPAGFESIRTLKLEKARILAGKAIEAYKADLPGGITKGSWHAMEKGDFVLIVVLKLLGEGRVLDTEKYWESNRSKLFSRVLMRNEKLSDIIESAFRVSKEESYRIEVQKAVENSIKNIGLDLKNIKLWDFNNYLNSINFKAEIASSIESFSDEKGLIKLNEAEISYIAKNANANNAVLEFVIDGNKNKIPGINLIMSQKDGKILNASWNSKNVNLASVLNNDNDLMLKLENEFVKGNLLGGASHTFLNSVIIDGKSVYTPRNHAILIDHGLHNLPSKEYFDAMNKVAYYIRNYS